MKTSLVAHSAGPAVGASGLLLQVGLGVFAALLVVAWVMWITRRDI